MHTLANPVMGAEDFSYVLQKVPGSMAFLGACPPELNPRTAPPKSAPMLRSFLVPNISITMSRTISQCQMLNEPMLVSYFCL